ncbi:MAG: DUF4268 domain-containing protein, partial [Bacteroidetes bacterium]|nr:DUF4268 domain-containing protein [Bacteroidota bacterium]
IGTEIYIDDNKELFRFLKDQQASIESQLNCKLDWIEADKACRVIQRRQSSNISDEANSKVLFDWLIERADTFIKVFGPLVKKFKEE